MWQMYIGLGECGQSVWAVHRDCGVLHRDHSHKHANQEGLSTINIDVNHDQLHTNCDIDSDIQPDVSKIDTIAVQHGEDSW